MTALNDGRVLVAGGLDANSTARGECEIFNPATATWTLTDPLKVPRTLHSMVKLNDGRVAVFGGQIGHIMDVSPVQTTKVEIFDPTTNTWSDGGELQMTRQHQTASLLPDGRVLIAAGLSGSSPTEQCEIYDPASATSALIAPLHLARYEHQAVALSDGRVMVSGGRNGGWNGSYFNETEIYDPTTNAWTVVGDMYQSRMRAVLAQFGDGSILSAAGRNTPTSAAPGSELFDLTTNSWSLTDPMKLPCTWMGPVLLPDDRYLVTGGFYDASWTSSSTDVTCTATTEWYDKKNACWYYAPQMEQERGRHQAVFVHQTVNDELPTDLILVAGGITGNNTYTNTCEYLDATPQALLTYKAMPANHPQSGESGVSVAAGATSGAVVQYTDGNAVIHFTLPSDGSANVDLISTDGRLVHSYNQTSIPAGTYDLNFGSSSLPSGAYIADVRTASWQGRLKVLIMH